MEHHRHRIECACGVALLMVAPQMAHATFTGLTVEGITDNDDGLKEYAIYANFDVATDVLISVGNTNIISTTGFFHNTINGQGAQALPFTSAMSAVSDNPDADSFVTIGLATGDGNGVVTDPNFNLDLFLDGHGLGENAGWINLMTFNGQGLPDELGRVLIAVFTPLNDSRGVAGVVSGTVMVGYDDGPGPPVFAFDSFVTPGPGMLPLQILATLAAGSRRRR